MLFLGGVRHSLLLPTLPCAPARLFLIEGLVAVLVSFSFFFMPKDTDSIKSLTPEEREALHASMAHTPKPVHHIKQLLLGAIKNPAVWIAGAGIKFMRDIAFYGTHGVLVGMAGAPCIAQQCELHCPPAGRAEPLAS